MVARAVANWNRRQISREEKAEWINGLARLYQKQGYKISDKFPFENEIVQKITEVTGLHKNSVTTYLGDEYKHSPRGGVPKGTYPIPASERIEHELGSEYVERLRKEILEEQQLQQQLLFLFEEV